MKEKLHSLCLLLGLTLLTPAFSQNPMSKRALPIANYFKDISFHSTNSFTPVFPIENQTVNYYERTRDSSKRYSTIGHFLYQRELIELSSGEGKIWISPLFDFSLGKQFSDSNNRILQNTRGARIEGVLGEKVFFTTSFYENQAVFGNYISDYVQQRGELYPNSSDSSYSMQNAVIPGSARTKYFKTNGFDYAYATGNIRWQATKKLGITWGNQSLFVGSGYRSMLWSDNSVPAMNLRIRYEFSKKWDLQFVKMRGLNLLRRPIATNGEAYYEPKSLSFSTLYFHPNSNWSIGLFEGGMWYRGDSLQKTAIQASYFIPVPGGALLQEALKTDCYSLTGIDFNFHTSLLHFYGQFGLNLFQGNSEVAQIGARFFPLKKSNTSFLQVEFNHAGKYAYTANAPRIHYTNYNLPIAHPMGRGLDELIVRGNYEWKNLFVQFSSSIYFNQSADYGALLPVYRVENFQNQQVVNSMLEIGYRINRAYGLELFSAFRYRYSSSILPNANAVFVSGGMRTNLTNHNFDF